MIAWQMIERVEVPGSGQKLELFRRGHEWSIRIGGAELMNSRQHGSEEALAELACAPIADRDAPRVMIGGLGMGFTLRAALDQLGPRAELVVAELVPAVVEWNRGEMGALAGHPLRDRRVRVELGDVAALIAAAPGRYDAIALDVDNGPTGLTRESNDALYATPGLRSAFAALRPGGVLAIWSAAGAPAFSTRVRRVGFEVQVHDARSRGSRGGGHHTLWIARKPIEKPRTNDPAAKRRRR